MAVLTISREVGSGGREIGYSVAELLNYALINKEQILSEVRKAGTKWERWGTLLDEHCPTVWEKYDWSFRGFGALIQARMLQYAARDRVIIMGRGGNFLMRDVPHALGIRVTAPLDQRIERIMRRDSVDRETAQWLAEKTDRERAGFIQALYGKNWNDPHEYDMVFDAGVTPVREITEHVKDALLRRDALNTEEARNTLRMRALAAEIKAEIFTDPDFFVPTLDVMYDGKGLVLRGVIHHPKEHKKIEEKAKHMAGAVPLRCELHYRA